MLCCVMFMLRCRTCNVCYVIITCYIYVIEHGISCYVI